MVLAFLRMDEVRLTVVNFHNHDDRPKVLD